MTEVVIGGVIERDIDFLLMEDLVASPAFLGRLAHHANIPGRPQLISIAHSSTSATGETDIELRLELDGESVFVLLENKVDAPLQIRQAERYKERALRYVKEGACTRCVTGLIAPAKYLAEAPDAFGFDFAIQYEQILDWYYRDPAPDDPRPFKVALLRRAIDRGAIGWSLVPHEGVTEFWRRYWDLARALAPELQMPKPTLKAETSAFVFFKPAEIPRGLKLIHKARYGNVDIQFDGKADQIAQLTARYGPLLEPGMALQGANKSAVVRIEVPVIDLTAPFSESEAAVREGIWAAKLLLLWFKALPRRVRAA